MKKNSPNRSYNFQNQWLLSVESVNGPLSNVVEFHEESRRQPRLIWWFGTSLYSLCRLFLMESQEGNDGFPWLH
uniref:hypothetical protein n=1 Tax=Vibrio cholerae TaxID=666 RepID=UPI0019603682